LAFYRETGFPTLNTQGAHAEAPHTPEIAEPPLASSREPPVLLPLPGSSRFGMIPTPGNPYLAYFGAADFTARMLL
jgi:hypothetical protein